MQPRILVLDGNQRASLAAVRSLGSKHLWVAVGEASEASMAGSSRFCSHQVRYSDPFLAPRAFFDDVSRTVEALGITFLLPITEATTFALLRYRKELPDTLVLPFASSESVEQLANKNELFHLSESLNIPIPGTLYCHDRQQGLEALNQIDQFPVVLKPFKSRILGDYAITPTRVIIARTDEEARTALENEPFFDFPFTVQNFIEGHGQGVFALFDKGEPVCFFAHRRLREKPPGGGVSVLCESASVDPQLRDYSEKLLRHAHWHGVAMVEFRVSADNRAYLMEVNTRFWGSLQLAIDSGIDFPWWLYQINTGQTVAVSNQKFRRVRWLLGDLDRLYLILKAPLDVYPISQKLKEIFYFLKPNAKTRHEVNRIRDLRPFLYELRAYLKALTRL
jgi:predicted ATP-grasp superfamily ATP-dependent carboligase